MSSRGWPARYEVRVEGVLDDRWSEWFGLRIQTEGGETVLSGTLPDQAALRGVLDKVCDLGLSVIAVRRLPPGEEGDEPHACAPGGHPERGEPMAQRVMETDGKTFGKAAARSVIHSVIRLAAITAVFAPLTIARHRRTSRGRLTT